MKKWPERIRGTLGMGLTWAAAWLGGGTIVGLVLVGGGGVLALAQISVMSTVAGFVGGVIFSAVLGIAEGRRRFDEMSLPRFATWGAVGGLLMSLLIGGGGLPVIMAAFMLLGAGSAAGSLALARRADPLLGAGRDVDLLGKV